MHPYQLLKKRFDPYWVRFVLRPLSFPLTWIFLRLGFSANQVSYLSVFISLLAAVLMWSGDRLLVILGAVLYNFWALLDCVDGNVARVRDDCSKYGEFADSIGGYSAYAFVFLAIGVAADRTKALLPVYLDDIDFVFVGAIASIANLTMRLIYHQFQRVSGKQIMVQASFERVIDANLGITGLLMPFVLIGAISNQLHWLVIFYAIFHVAALLIVGFKLAVKAGNLKKEEQS